MKKLVIILSAVVFLSTTAFVFVQQNRHTEAAKHPRIENAIKELESAIDYLEKAPDDFGGYKTQAIADSKKAVLSLKLALNYRAKVDNNKKK
jgi:ABC-type microcin C transport system duplicated ATPase subunit YejF